MTSIFLWAHCVFFFFIHFPFDAVSARWFCMLVYVTETMPLSGLLFALLVEFSCSIYFYQNGIVMWVVYGSNYDEIYISENLEQARARSLFTQLLICCLNGFVAGVTHRRNLNLIWFGLERMRFSWSSCDTQMLNPFANQAWPRKMREIVHHTMQMHAKTEAIIRLKLAEIHLNYKNFYI